MKTEVFGYADWLNVMSYDDFSTTTAYKQHSSYNTAVASSNYWLNTRGMPKSKFVLGLPAYGRPSGNTQSGTVYRIVQFWHRAEALIPDSAIVSAGAFTNYTIYYNGQPTIKRKAILAKQIGNGVMMWEHGQDSFDASSLLKSACDTVGKAYESKVDAISKV